MPRKNPVPERERAICRRLREFRITETKLSQIAFAHAVGLDSSALASYEHGRVPLRYEVVKRIGERSGINQRWLAEGIEPKRWYVPIHSEIESKIEAGSLFSQAYDSRLKDHLGKVMSKYAIAQSIGAEFHLIAPLGAPLSDNYAWQMSRWIKEIFDMVPPELADEFYTEIKKFCAAFKQKHKAEIQQYQQRKSELERRRQELK